MVYHHPFWLHAAGVELQQGFVLDREIDELAATLVKSGVTPSKPWSGMNAWAEAKSAQVYPNPGVLPPIPREPPLNPMAMAFLVPFLVVASAVVLLPAAKNSSLITAGVIFWIGYICLWIASGIWSRVHSDSLVRYWATYDPHHRHRPNLRLELGSALKRAIEQAWHEFHRPVAAIPMPQVATQPRAPLPWSPISERPSPMTSCTDREAEFLVQRWMQFLGAKGCIVSGATRDGGADVISDDFVAEVKHHSAPVSPGYVRQIFGVATAERKKALFFSLSGYSDASIQFGEQTGMALFAYSYIDATILPKSTAAHRALEQGLQSLITS